MTNAPAVSIARARNRAEAVRMIEDRESIMVELDYEDGCRDVLALAKLGRENLVGILYRPQEPILVESMDALLQGLLAEKTTFRQRHLFCMFSLAACDQEDFKRAQIRAAMLGDVICPGDAILSPYPYNQWKS